MRQSGRAGLAHRPPALGVLQGADDAFADLGARLRLRQGPSRPASARTTREDGKWRMTVRFAIKEDIPGLVELGREAHVESRYAWLSYSPERVWEQIDKAIQRNDHCCLVAHDAKQEPYGFLHGYTEEYFFARARAARLEFLYILPKRRGGLDAMKMLAGFRQWAIKK